MLSLFSKLAKLTNYKLSKHRIKQKPRLKLSIFSSIGKPMSRTSCVSKLLILNSNLFQDFYVRACLKDVKLLSFLLKCKQIYFL